MFDDKEKENFAFCLTSSVVVFFIEFVFRYNCNVQLSYNFLYYSFLQKNIKILS